MSAMNQKRLKITPPDKGSFPLDHDGVCKELMIRFKDCLKENDNKTTKCRSQIKEYLECRMNNNLMTREPWKKLGFDDDEVELSADKKN